MEGEERQVRGTRQWWTGMAGQRVKFMGNGDDILRKMMNRNDIRDVDIDSVWGEGRGLWGRGTDREIKISLRRRQEKQWCD